MHDSVARTASGMATWELQIGGDPVTIDTTPPGQPPRIRVTFGSGKDHAEGSPTDMAAFRTMIAAAMNTVDGSRTDGPTS